MKQTKRWGARALWWLAAAGGCGAAEAPDAAVRNCSYTNTFTETPECREYHGAWSEMEAGDECTMQSGSLAEGACAQPATLGTCVLTITDEQEVRIVFTGDDISQCPVLSQACVTFLRGDFVATDTCADHVDDPLPQGEPEADPLVERVCMAPVDGEPAGMSPGGEVCTWSSIQGCTEEGRNYADYASCEPTYARGYYPDVPAANEGADPRMADPSYAAEVEWIRGQLNACSCVCCHQGSVTKEGATIWDTELEGNFLNSVSPWGLAFMAGFVDSSILGQMPAADNNGFARDVTGMPTTDTKRVLEFFTAELAHRGYTPDDNF